MPSTHSTLDNSKFEVREETPSHCFCTEIPNVVEQVVKDPYEFRVYMHLKRMAGEGGACFSSNKNIAEACGMSDKKVRQVKQKLAMRNPLLGNLPLIQITKREKYDGSRTTDIVTITDMWQVNFQNFYSEESNV